MPDLVPVIDTWEQFYKADEVSVAGWNSYDPDPYSEGNLIYLWECFTELNEKCLDIKGQDLI